MMRKLLSLGQRVLKPALVWGVLFLVLAEAVARVWLFYIADGETFHRFASVRQIQARNDKNIMLGIRMPYGLFPTPNFARGENRHDALGYRGTGFPIAKPEGEFRIVCLGGSTTYTEGVEDYRKAYPALMGDFLRAAGWNVRVINAGCPGWTSRESVMNYAFRVRYLDPDLLVVYHGINDLFHRATWPVEKYASDYGLSERPFPDFVIPTLWDYSVFLRTVRVSLGLAESPSVLFGGFRADMPGVTLLMHLMQEAEGDSYEYIFGDATLADIFAANTPAYYAHNLRSLVTLAQADEVGVVLATFASDEASMLHMAPRAGADYAAGMAEMNAAMRGVAEQTGARLLPFAERMPKGPEYWDDFIHVNEAGSKVKAEIFAQQLIEARAIPETYRKKE